MTRVLSTFVALLFVGFAAINGTYTANSQTGPGWIQLFNGKNLDGWDSFGTAKANWRVEDGALIADKLVDGKGSSHLVTKSSYKDHQIYAEFWSSDDANSGIFVRCNPKQIGSKTCYEVNIFDQRKDPSYGTGAIVNFAEVNPMPKAGGKWNTFDITAKGRNITVSLNGKQTVNLHNGMFTEGHFTLQYGSGVIKWRKVAVRPL